jgi:hypothetical protein
MACHPNTLAALKPFKPGMSGNPGGKPAKARNKLTTAFIKDLLEVYEAKGKPALEKLVDDDPSTFFKALVGLCPKQVETPSQFDEMDTDTLTDMVSSFKAWRATHQLVPHTPALTLEVIAPEVSTEQVQTHE